MKLLLDTHALIWTLGAPQRLPAAAHQAIRSPENEVYASLASAWEIAIKVALGSLDFDVQTLEQALGVSGIQALGISLQHTARVANLPPHHRDPFDRMLVAQALCESMTLVSRDRQLRRYGVTLFWGSASPARAAPA